VRPQNPAPLAAAGVRGERGMRGPCSLGLARAGRFLWVWRQMFFSGRPLDWAVGGSGQERDGRRPRVENLAGFRVRLSICLPAMRKVLSTRDRYACDDPCLGTQKVYYGKKIHPLNANLRHAMTVTAFS
jgi:hypothetical protein